MENKQPVTIGVDVSKETLETALLFTDNSFAEQQFSNDAKGIKQLLSWATSMVRNSVASALRQPAVLS